MLQWRRKRSGRSGHGRYTFSVEARILNKGVGDEAAGAAMAAALFE